VRVAVYHNNNDVRIENRPRPVAGPGELLVRVKASGICGSDVMEWYRLPKAPVVLGHEIAGVIEEAGDGVEGFAVGDRVVTTHHVPCGECRYCVTDRHSVCETLRTTSFDPGGFAEFVRLPAINVRCGTFKLPDGVGFDEASFVEPLACVVRALRLSRLRRDDVVAVLGSGVSGILMIQVARALGASKIVATDVDEHRLEMALRFGADAALPAGDALDSRLRDVTGGRMPEQVVVCTGARAAIEESLQIVDLGGTVLFFAPLDPGESLALDMNDLWKRGVNIVHSYAGPPADMRVALEWIAGGRVDVASMVTDRVGLEQTAEGFRRVLDGGAALKVLVEP